MVSSQIKINISLYIKFLSLSHKLNASAAIAPSSQFGYSFIKIKFRNNVFDD